MDRIKRLKQKETRLVNKGNKVVDEGREKKAEKSKVGMGRRVKNV